MNKTNSINIRLPNWLGDVIMALPALYALQQSGFTLNLLGKPWIHDLLADFPADKYSVPTTSEQLRILLRTLPSKKTLLFTNNFASAWNCRLSRQNSIGYRTDWRRMLLNHSIAKPKNKHEVEIFWKLAQAAQLRWMPHSTWPLEIPKKIILPLKVTYDSSIHAQLSAFSSRTKILLCPNAAGLSPQKQSKIWPYWSELGKRLKQDGYFVITAPGPNEEEQCLQLLPQAYCIQNLNLQQLARLMTTVNLVIANDTGPMHLAASCSPKTLGLFGATNPERTSPWGCDYLGKLGQWPNVDEVYQFINQLDFKHAQN